MQISVVANQFVIRHINPNSDDFMFSSNMYDVAKRNNLWNEAMGELDFTRTFAPPRAHSPYATRWGLRLGCILYSIYMFVCLVCPDR
jgi:dipeptidase